MKRKRFIVKVDRRFVVEATDKANALLAVESYLAGCTFDAGKPIEDRQARIEASFPALLSVERILNGNRLLETSACDQGCASCEANEFLADRERLIAEDIERIKER